MADITLFSDRVQDRFAKAEHAEMKSKTALEKRDRSTHDQVLDQKTEMILFQMINAGVMSGLEGVLSTGKEANVYLGAVDDPEDMDGGVITYRAAKVYKTSILSFVDREQYIAGDHRFRRGEVRGSKHNKRAMVSTWAEKEFCNLQRLQKAGIPCPTPLKLKENVLVMSLLGNRAGRAYPRLRDAKIQPEKGSDGKEQEDPEESVARQWKALYIQLLSIMRRLYRVCRLVHADLSEYNILYHKGTLYIIDVSQSVGHEHPMSYDFLRMDIRNVNKFFNTRLVDTLRDRAVFEFITRVEGPVEMDELAVAIEELYKKEAEAKKDGEDAHADEVDNKVFQNAYIPRSLDNMYDAAMAQSSDEAMAEVTKLYQHLLADRLAQDKAAAEEEREGEANGDEEGESEELEDDDDASETSSRSHSDSKTPSRGKKFQDKEAKHAHKMAVKEQKREQRKNKMPKKVKKGLVDKSKRR